MSSTQTKPPIGCGSPWRRGFSGSEETPAPEKCRHSSERATGPGGGRAHGNWPLRVPQISTSGVMILCKDTVYKVM